MGTHSDVDILVVVPENTPRRRTAQAISMNLFGLPGGVDVIVATEKDLREYGDNFSLVYDPALREGREIYATQGAETRLTG